MFFDLAHSACASAVLAATVLAAAAETLPFSFYLGGVMHTVSEPQPNLTKEKR
jgi:hypothetical protein